MTEQATGDRDRGPRSGTSSSAPGPDDFGFVSTGRDRPRLPGARRAPSTRSSTALLVIVFLLFEPLGLYGIWIKIRNYWKGWPFTY